MNDAKLAEILYSIGHEIFAEYYGELSDPSLSMADLIERLLTDSRNAGKGRSGGGYTIGTCRSKVSHGRRIIRAGRGVDALRLIADSTNERAREHALAQLRAMQE